MSKPPSPPLRKSPQRPLTARGGTRKARLTLKIEYLKGYNAALRKMLRGMGGSK